MSLVLFVKLSTCVVRSAPPRVVLRVRLRVTLRGVVIVTLRGVVVVTGGGVVVHNVSSFRVTVRGDGLYTACHPGRNSVGLVCCSGISSVCLFVFLVVCLLV